MKAGRSVSLDIQLWDFVDKFGKENNLNNTSEALEELLKIAKNTIEKKGGKKL